MTPETRELLRLTLLQLAAPAGSTGLTLSSYHLGVRTRGISCPTDAIADALQYHEDKGLLVTLEKTVSPELKRWRITASGRDFLAAEGLE